MAALALADEAFLETAASGLPADLARYTFLRRPEAGLLMVEGRTGNSGERFNIGEMLVTRCVILLAPPDGEVAEGYAFIRGNRPRHAELAALFDALLQREERGIENRLPESLERTLIAPLCEQRRQTLEQRARESAPTRVNFFTLVRGENA